MQRARQAAPQLDPALRWVWRAWHRLALDRPFYGGGLGPSMPGRIPWSSVRMWADLNGYSEDDADFLDACVIAMDGVYLKQHAEQVKLAMENR